MALPEPYFKIVTRKEAFGSDDHSSDFSVIRLITNENVSLKPLETAAQLDKNQYSNLKKEIEKDSKLTVLTKDDYVEFDGKYTENQIKSILESKGLNEFD